MHDVLRQLVVAGGDEDLVAADAVAAVRVRLGARGDVGQAGAGLRLGQRHGAEEAAGEQGLEVLLLLRGRAEAADHVGVADAEKGIARGRHVGALEERKAGLRHRHRQLHAAERVVVGGGGEAGVDEGLQGFLHLRDHGYALAVELRLVLVGLPVMGGELLRGDGLGGVQRGEEGLARVVGETRPRRQRLGVEELEEDELQVAAVDDACGHADRPPPLEKGEGRGILRRWLTEGC